MSPRPKKRLEAGARVEVRLRFVKRALVLREDPPGEVVAWETDVGEPVALSSGEGFAPLSGDLEDRLRTAADLALDVALEEANREEFQEAFDEAVETAAVVLEGEDEPS